MAFGVPACVFRFWALLCSFALAAGSNFQLTILHTNDIHARFDQSNKYGSLCTERDAQKNTCYGGYARLATAVKEGREQANNTLLLDGGDQYQGTLWFYKYGGNVTSHFMNMVGYDVMALGNHEFDRGVEGLAPFLKEVNFDLVSANINASKVPDVRDHVAKSVTKTIGGEVIGIIGYTTEDTPEISDTGEVEFDSVVQSVTAEVINLECDGVNKIIAVGHAGFTVDKKIARIPGVDVVVGGHTNTFLYTGTPLPSIEQPAGPYPTVVQNMDGTQTLVVQAYTFGKYLGILKVDFNATGHVVDWDGNPRLLDHSVTQDPAVVAELQPWKEALEGETKKEIGRTKVYLTGNRDICRRAECNLGSLITDAMVHQNMLHPNELKWGDVAVALLNSGGIKSSIPKGKITIGSVLRVLPFQGTISTLRLKGSTLRKALEHSVSRPDPCNTEDLAGAFLQVSGVWVTYNLSQPVGQRVDEVKVKCITCKTPSFVALSDTVEYKVIMNDYIANGGDGYTMFREEAVEREEAGDLDTDVLIEYIVKETPISIGVEDRITFVDSECKAAQ